MNVISKKFTYPLLASTWLFTLLMTATAEEENTESVPEPAPPKVIPKTSVQIVNATSVAEISIMVDEEMFYPKFPQGLYTGDAPTPKLKPLYTATELSTKTSAEHKATYVANSHQSLIMTGDFKMVPVESDDDSDQKKTESKMEPRVYFTVMSHDLEESEQPLRYRFFNGLMDQRVIINDGKTAQWLEPNQTLTFTGQPMVKTFTATINEQTQTVLIRQEGGARNCTIIFFEKDGEPTFMRAFENTSKTLDQLETEEE